MQGVTEEEKMLDCLCRGLEQLCLRQFLSKAHCLGLVRVLSRLSLSCCLPLSSLFGLALCCLMLCLILCLVLDLSS